MVKEGQSIILFTKHCEEGEMRRETVGRIRGMQSRTRVERRREGGREGRREGEGNEFSVFTSTRSPKARPG